MILNYNQSDSFFLICSKEGKNMNNIIKSKKGFTLVELVIVIVIVGILSVISVPIYRGYVDRAMRTEGEVLLGAIAKAELAYHVEHGYFADTDGGETTGKLAALGMDASGNKYFKSFGIQSAFTGNYTSDYKKIDSAEICVYGENNRKKWKLRAVQYSDGPLYGFGPNDEIVEESEEIQYPD